MKNNALLSKYWYNYGKAVCFSYFPDFAPQNLGKWIFRQSSLADELGTLSMRYISARSEMRFINEAAVLVGVRNTKNTSATCSEVRSRHENDFRIGLKLESAENMSGLSICLVHEFTHHFCLFTE